MKISLNWLKEYIDIEGSPEEIGNILTGTGLEVEKYEAIESVRGGLEGLVIGEVVECFKHSGADKLKITKVDTGSAELSQIICGAPNVAEGQKVIVALPGTTIYPVNGDPFEIKKAKIRGKYSYGMICAEDEIGIGEDHSGIIILNTDLPNGTPAASWYEIEKDVVYEIGLTPNRGDATSHIGVARDLRAVSGKDISWPDLSAFKAGTSSEIEVEVKNSEACPRYSGVVISGVEVKESPNWLKNRLRSVGLSPINNIVDITNFVAQEVGQPLHAFDADAIAGNKVIVQTLKEKSPFTTLDGVERKLSAEDLMICNKHDGMCIAGVFGGEASGIRDTTNRVFLESAYFSPDFIRATALRHQLKTDASFRYERGTDPEITIYALKRAALLMAEIAGGNVSSEVVDIYPEKVEDNEIDVKYSHVDRLIGKKIDRDKIEEILSYLDIRTKNKTNQGFTAVSPAYRIDVNREADIIEEILRIYGFNNIPIPENVSADYMAHFPEKDQDKLRNMISEYLTSRGFYEAMTNSLTKPVYSAYDPDVDEKNNVEILNKLSEDLSVLRQKAYYNLLEVISYNQSHKQRNLCFYEFGKSYRKVKNKYREEPWLIIAMTGDNMENSWDQKSHKLSFYDLSRHVLNSLEMIDQENLNTSVADSGSYEYSLDYSINNSKVAQAGLLNRKLCKQAGVKGELFIAEINWEKIVKYSKQSVVYREVPKFPEVKRDLSLVLNKGVVYGKVKDLAVKAGGKLVKSIQVFDVYEGENIGADKKAYALSFTLQDEEKTLTDKVIDKTMTKLMTVFEKELGASIRK